MQSVSGKIKQAFKATLAEKGGEYYDEGGELVARFATQCVPFTYPKSEAEQAKLLALAQEFFEEEVSEEKRGQR